MGFPIYLGVQDVSGYSMFQKRDVYIYECAKVQDVSAEPEFYRKTKQCFRTHMFQNNEYSRTTSIPE